MLTESLCPVCYRRIPANIYIDQNVMMTKKCPVHGEFTSMVERDPEWFNLAQSKEIYNGTLIDVTSRCNIKCKYCYHDNNGIERTIEEIYQDALDSHAPFILTGGEPTLHKDIKEIILKLKTLGEVNLLTNGIKLSDEKYFDEVMPLLATQSEIHNVSLSLHKESEGKDLEFLELCKKKGIKIWTCFYVIDDLKQIDEAIEIFRAQVGTIDNFRIKVASNLWNEGNAKNKIFVSDVIKYLFALDETEFQPTNQKVSYAQVWHDGLDIKIVSWYDVKNIDLWDIDCAPYYKAQDGKLYNFVTSAVMNEGFESKRIRRAYPCDIPKCADLWVDMAKEENPSYTPNKEIWSAKMNEFIKHDRNHLYVAELDSEIVGFVSGYWDYDELTSEKTITGINFYVKPELRKTDIGKMLHLKYKDVGQRLGVKRVIRKVTKSHSEVLFKKGQEFTHYVIEERI